ncbi:MAG: hypothetical protein CL933_19095 [Deltaproteobacteria bacterium]|nr:hypothetical protein [Deltaproteobacteria bacterium]
MELRSLAIALSFALFNPSCHAPGDLDPLCALAEESAHELHRVRGWPVFLHGEWARSNPALAEAVVVHLDVQLYQVERAVLGERLDALREVPIWVEPSDPHDRLGGMCYHPDAGWLSLHGYDPRRALGVEISDPEMFLGVTRTQPWVVMHELAHAYHHRVLGFDEPRIIALFDAAVESGDYEETFRLRGRLDRHYALSNHKEYFAEGTEAYLGTNDYYPFVRGELERHDPGLHALLRELWED